MSLTIALDGMGGDHAPEIVVEGAVQALGRQPDLAFLLFGDAARLEPLVRARPRLQGRVSLRHTPDFVAGDAKPSLALRQGRNSSMRLAIDAVKGGEAAAAVSAGNTGALMAMAKFVLRTHDGIDRHLILRPAPDSLEGMPQRVEADPRPLHPEFLEQLAEPLGYRVVELGLDLLLP